MSGKKSKKIVMPTDDEISAYGGDRPQGQTPPGETNPGPSEPAPPPASDEPGSAAAAEDRSEAEEWKEKFLRAKAELVNYQRRSEKDHADALRFANARLVQALLPILDDLERVITSGAETGGDIETLVSGVKLTAENFAKVLRSFNVVPIDAVGQPFDPAVHEAMMQRDSDEYPEPTVLEELTRGYQLHDRVLRPARVIVSKPPPRERPEEPASQDEA